jgi:hypothetical protein
MFEQRQGALPVTRESIILPVSRELYIPSIHISNILKSQVKDLALLPAPTIS